LSREISLREHLGSQLSVDIADPIDRMIGLHLIDLVDDAGYLTGPTSQVAELLNCPVERVEATWRCCSASIRGRVRAQPRRMPDPAAQGPQSLDPCMEALIANLHLLAARDYEALRGCAASMPTTSTR